MQGEGFFTYFQLAKAATFVTSYSSASRSSITQYLPDLCPVGKIGRYLHKFYSNNVNAKFQRNNTRVKSKVQSLRN